MDVYSPVLKPMTDEYRVDRNGYWEGMSDYTYSNAFYDFTFYNLQTTGSEFTALMRQFQAVLVAEGNAAKSNPFVLNLLLLISYSVTITNGLDEQFFTFTGQPNDLYGDESYRIAGIGSVNGSCQATTVVGFDVYTAVASLTWGLADYQSQQCDSAVTPPASLGWTDRSGNTIAAQLDTVSIHTALAINSGVFALGRLQLVGLQYRVYRGLIFGRYIDPSYQHMRPVHCFSKLREDDPVLPTLGDSFYHEQPSAAADAAYDSIPAQDQWFCYVNFANQLALPTVNHYDQNCLSCAEPVDPYCQVFDVMIGVVYFPTYMGDWKRITAAYHQYPSYMQLNQAAYPAAYITTELLNRTAAAGAFDFCDNECVVVAINFYPDLSIDDHSIDEYHTQVPNMHCSDVITIPPEAFDRVANNPPTSLIESYYKCVQKPGGALITAIGIAAGSKSYIYISHCILTEGT